MGRVERETNGPLIITPPFAFATEVVQALSTPGDRGCNCTPIALQGRGGSSLRGKIVARAPNATAEAERLDSTGVKRKVIITVLKNNTDVDD